MTAVTPAFDLVSLHPDMLRGALHTSVIGRAVERGVLEIGIHDLREWTTDRHRTADDTPYGGGAGMVLKADLVGRALADLRRPDTRVLLTSPGGRPLTQATARRLGQESHVVIVCGHYEGIDARVESQVDELISLGDFVLTGGEIAAAAVVDATARLRPGVLGNDESALEESFHDDLLEYPHYTRPAELDVGDVPEVLRSGHHGRIAAWRLAQARARTHSARPDLWIVHAARHGLDPDAPVLDPETGKPIELAPAWIRDPDDDDAG